MEVAIFALFAALALASAVVVVVHRNPVHSVMSLVVTLVSLAGLFVMLGAPFVAALQVLIYTGAIDAFQFAAMRPPQFEPNTFGRYRNDNPMLLGMLIRDAVRARGEEYLTWPQRALFDKLGIRRQVLETDPYGNFLLSGYDYGTARNWARIGLLYLQDGMWQGTRILPEGGAAHTAIELAVAAHNLSQDFPAEALREARGYGKQVSKSAATEREDLSGVPLVTIDGADLGPEGLVGGILGLAGGDLGADRCLMGLVRGGGGGGRALGRHGAAIAHGSGGLGGLLRDLGVGAGGVGFVDGDPGVDRRRCLGFRLRLRLRQDGSGHAQCDQQAQRQCVRLGIHQSTLVRVGIGEPNRAGVERM